MKLCVSATAIAWIALIASGCGQVSDKSCTTNADCVEGFSCKPDESDAADSDTSKGECVETEPLSVVTQRLPDATVGVAYRTTLQAAGGIEPYTWELGEYYPGWMHDGLGAETGVLNGTPDAPGSDLAVSVVVTDHSADSISEGVTMGKSVTAQLLISVHSCVESSSQPCYVAEDGTCLYGVQTCSDSEWGPCSTDGHSSSLNHCGPDCAACDPVLANACKGGLCTCGDNSACDADHVCCDEACVDLQASGDNCGACGNQCSVQIQNADDPHCEQGHCDYSECEDAYLDLDGDRSNGCEYQRDLENCGAVGDSCEETVQNATGLICASDAGGDFGCDYEACTLGYLDCDSDRHNGCEQQVDWAHCGACDANCNVNPDGHECILDQDDQQQDFYRCGCSDVNGCGPQDTYQCCDNTCQLLTAPDHCGDCETDCSASLDGPVCVDGENHVCGCLQDEDCTGMGDLCCDNKCIPFDLNNCGVCGRTCSTQYGGPNCDIYSGQCYCGDDAECNPSSGGQQLCVGEGTAARCECNVIEGACPGGVWQCCVVEGQPTCVDSWTDHDNCGRCGVACDDSENCQAGRCGCHLTSPPVPVCPENSPAPDCNAHSYSLCGCQYNPADPTSSCSQGRLCCDGESGGEGGPGGSDDIGCCWNPCGENQPGDCLY